MHNARLEQTLQMPMGGSLSGVCEELLHRIMYWPNDPVLNLDQVRTSIEYDIGLVDIDIFLRLVGPVRAKRSLKIFHAQWSFCVENPHESINGKVTHGSIFFDFLDDSTVRLVKTSWKRVQCLFDQLVPPTLADIAEVLQL